MKSISEVFERSNGFGDTVSKIIKTVAPNLEECGGCSKRRAMLNKLIPYNRK
jgi:hypothetical protein